MKILLTGASGILGRALLPELKKLDASITAVYHKSKINDSCAVHVDLTNQEECKSKLSHDFDMVIHLAYDMGDLDWNKNKRDNKLNEKALMMLKNIHSIVGSNVRFINASSVSVYGSQQSEEPIEEGSYLNGKTPYAKAKIMCEKYVAKNFSNSCSLRFSRIVSHEGKNIFNIFSHKAKQGETITVNATTDGRTPNYSYISVLGAAHICKELLFYSNVTGAINVCEPMFEMSLQDLAKKMTIKYGGYFKVNKGGLSDDEPVYAVVDSSKLVNTGISYFGTPVESMI